MSKPFSLEKALAGEPIEFKGYKCYLHARISRENAYIVESATSHTILNSIQNNTLIHLQCSQTLTDGF